MASENLRFGRTYYIQPIGTHTTTIVWLHELGESGRTAVEMLRNSNALNPHVKWVCPTAPKRSVSSYGGQKATAWCDHTGVHENMQDDFDNLNLTNTKITELFTHEPENVVKGVGGFGLGAAQALYYTSCYAFGWVPICPQIVVGINGWLPGRRFLEHNMNYTNFGTTHRARSTQILLMHGTMDNGVPVEFAYSCAVALQTAEFPTLFKISARNDVMNEIRNWMRSVIG